MGSGIIRYSYIITNIAASKTFRSFELVEVSCENHFIFTQRTALELPVEDLQFANPLVTKM